MGFDRDDKTILVVPYIKNITLHYILHSLRWEPIRSYPEGQREREAQRGPYVI